MDLWDNPLGTGGFEFVEYAAADPQALGALFVQMGFSAVARHRQKGDEGFGEDNFKALFESMELDQIRRGVLKTAS